MKTRCLYSLLLFSAVVFASCSKDKDKDDPIDPLVQLAKDSVAIDNYLADHSLAAIKDVTGVRIVVSDTGSGLPASYYLNSTVDVDYVGKLFTDGTTFDQGTTTGPMKNYITGWQIALASLPAGSKATVYIPSGYAYGDQKQSSIPANSILVFDINFKSIVVSGAQSTQFTKDTTAISKLLEESDSLYTKDATGITYRITKEGTGKTANLYDQLKLKYSFRLLSDTAKVVGEYEKGPSKDFHSRAVDYLQGMQIGLQKMKEGGKARLFIPSSLAFGPNTIRNSSNEVIITPNTSLVVDVELVDIVQ
jgi:FKBP-type peptidyl-prolyl cis-trans isomerase FkpA